MQTTGADGRSLVQKIRADLAAQIEQGQLKPGDRLPSESQLTERHGVSRTVVREALAGLRSDGLVEARKGSGVYVLTPKDEPTVPFSNLNMDRISQIIEMLELRVAIETEAAALAAVRHSPAQEERLIEALAEMRTRATKGEPSADADQALHMAVAEASNNPRFVEFLNLIGPGLIPRSAVASAMINSVEDFESVLDKEHLAIVSAIQSRDAEGAREAMRQHLLQSQARYRRLLRV